MRRVSAIISQLASFATTLSFAAFLLAGFPTLTGPQFWIASFLLALAGEGLLFGMKECIFQEGGVNKGIGVSGFAADGVINAGGLAVIVDRLLIFRPIASMLGLAEVDVASADGRLFAAQVGSMALGVVLSILPHVLWRERKPKAEKAR